MPLMVLNRDFYVRTTTPFSPAFKKGVPTDVHPDCVEAALAVGAVMADGSDAIAEQIEQKPVVPTGSEREQILHKSFEKLVIRKQRGDFTASGFPDLRVLNGMLEFRVDRAELEKSWEKYMAAKETV
jgi:hypothetical protein